MLAGHKESSARHAVIAGVMDTTATATAAVLSNSSVLLADSLKTGLEFVAVLLAWMAIRRMAKGGGSDYEYGIGKLENLASFVIGALMVIVFLIIIGSAIRSIIWPSHISGVGLWISLGIQVVFGCVNGYLYLNARRVARSENSPIMVSQAKLFFTKLFANAFILLALISSILLHDYAWSAYIDPIAALVVAASIIVSAMSVFSSSVYDLLDGTLEEQDKLKIMRALAENFDRYDMIYGVRCRRAGARAFIEVFLGFDEDKRVGEVQREIGLISRAVEEQVQNSTVMVIIGPEKSVAGLAPA